MLNIKSDLFVKKNAYTMKGSEKENNVSTGHKGGKNRH